MLPVYLVGPSGVGKSVLADKSVAACGEITHVNVDAEVKRLGSEYYADAENRWPAFWRGSLLVFEKWESSGVSGGKHAILDVGAGSLKTELTFKYFLEKGDRAIYLRRDPQKAYELVKMRDVPPWSALPCEAYIAEEFSELSRRIYAAACNVIDLTDTEDDVAQLLKICKGVWQ